MKKLNKYLSIAASTLSAGAVNAAVVYTDVNPDVNPDVNHDVNHDVNSYQQRALIKLDFKDVKRLFWFSRNDRATDGRMP